MCASSRTDGVDISGLSETVNLTEKEKKQARKLLDKIGKKEKKRPISEFLKSQGVKIQAHKDIGDRLDDMLADIPFIDAAVAVAGFYAGWHGFTPTTMLFKGMWGFGKTIEGATFDFGGIPIFDPFGLAKSEYEKAKARKDLTPDQQAALGLFDFNTPEGQMALYMKLSFGCIGLIEAVMITRPGALGGILQGVGSIMQGLGEIIPL